MKRRSWFLFCVMAACAASPVQAAGDASAGKVKAESCAGCHGEDGNGSVPIFPKLSGQKFSYLAKQLEDFKTGKRPEPTMSAMAAQMSEEDIADLSAYFAAQQLRVEQPAQNDKGRTVFAAGNPDSGVPACSGCHGPEAKGNEPAAFPALHAQHAAYLAKTLHDFKTESRHNDRNEMMRSIAERLTDEEITSVAEYLSGLQ